MVYGCCPLPNAHCCMNGQSCCPSSHVCDGSSCRPVLTAEKCLMATLSSEQPENSDAKLDHTPKNGTFCQFESGSYGFCQFKNAVCCSDKRHCCPKNFVCDLSSQACVKSANLRKPVSSQATCSDKDVCPNGTTCCKSSDGHICCPFPNASCCNDRHCCPEGYQCTTVNGSVTCKQSSEQQLDELF